MAIYSKKIIQFIEEIKLAVKNILTEEIRVKATKERFIIQHLNLSFPIKIIIFNDEKRIGYFDSSCYELGFHETLMNSSKEQLKNIIRHELAHYLTYIHYQEKASPHGVEFRDFCRSQGWGENVYLATTCLDDGLKEKIEQEGAILRKIEKLMALSKSSNPNEAELALIKSQQLLLKHHLENKSLTFETDEKIVMKRVLKQKKQDAKMQAISTILQTFFVSTVFSRKKDFTCLEIVGNPINVEIAEYVAAFLEQELDRLWSLTRKNHRALKGLVAKNSFFFGIGKGYVNKIEQLKNQVATDHSKELLILENQLHEATLLVYPHLRTLKRGGNYHGEALNLGSDAGKKLTIHKGVAKTKEKKGFSISCQI